MDERSGTVHKVGIPENIEFRTEEQIAREQIARALANNIPRGIVLADVEYGTEADFRDWLQTQKLDYVLGVRDSASVWWGKHQPAKVPQWLAEGRRRPLIHHDARHQPVSLLYVARALPSKMWRNITWRQGSNSPLSSRFARVRVRAPHHDRLRADEWLLIEWPEDEVEPVHYWLSTLPQDIFLQAVGEPRARAAG